MEEKQREQARLRKQKQRDKERDKSVTVGERDINSVTFFRDGVEMVPPLGDLPERPRYHVLSDGQVLDRASLPSVSFVGMSGSRLRAFSNLFNSFTPNKQRDSTLKIP